MDIKKIILIVIALLILLGIAYASPVRNVCTNSRCYCHYDRCNCSMERRICRKPVNYYDYGYYNRNNRFVRTHSRKYIPYSYRNPYGYTIYRTYPRNIGRSYYY